MNILVTFDQHYEQPFKVMLTSLLFNNPEEHFTVYLLHQKYPQDKLDSLVEYCNNRNVDFKPIEIDDNLFNDAPTTSTYPHAMYYRLVAPMVLPQDMDKILYLDPDLLVVNPLTDLYSSEFNDVTFMACNHQGVTNMINDINNIRLQTDTDYFNTGVILINLKKARETVHTKDIFNYIDKHEKELLLPDQDIFNALYGEETLSIPDIIYNYDARYFNKYLLSSEGNATIPWVMQNTCILHFCGKRKPWHANYIGKFGTLYQHYVALEKRNAY